MRTFRTRTDLALAAGITPQHLCDCQMGRRNLSGLAALNMAELTGTDPRLWLKGGSSSVRRRAVLGRLQEPKP